MSIRRRAFMGGSLSLLLLNRPSFAAERMVISEYGIVLNSLPWAVALETGLLSKLGTGVDGFIGANGGGTALRNMMASDLPFADLALPTAIAAVRTGIDLRLLFSGVNNMGELSWVVPVGSPIRELNDLKGRKVAFTSPRSTTEMVLRIILNKAGIADQVRVVSAGGLGAAVTALNQGAVDAAPMVDPLLSTATDRYRTVFAVNDYIPNLCWAVGVGVAAYARSHADKIRALIEARRQALELMRNDRDLAARVYAKTWNIDPALAAKLLPKFFDTNFWSPGGFDVPGLKTQVEGMRLVGSLEGAFDLEAMIDRSYLPADLRA